MASVENSTTLQSPASSSYKYTLYVSCEETSYSVENNTSTIECYASLGAKNISFNTTDAGTLTLYWYDSRTNTEEEIGSMVISYCGMSYGTKSLSATITRTHRDDGTLRGYPLARWSKNKSGSYIPASGEVETDWLYLTTIARASKPTATNGYIGQPILINTNRASSNFTHTLSVSFGSFSATIGTNIGESVGFILPNDFYAQIPNSSSGTGTITCTTYQGSTQIGSPQTTTFKAMCDPEVCKPTFDYNVVLTDGTATTSLTGSSSILIANYSQAEIQWTATPKNSATLKNVYVANLNTSYTTSPIDIDFENNSSLFTNGFNLVCYDSRNIGNAVDKSITIKQWFVPSFTLTTKRTSPTASEVKATFTGSFFNESFGQENNSLTLTWKYRQTGDSNWTNGGTLTSGTHYNVVGNNVYSGTTQGTATEIVLSSSVFDYDKTYEVGIFAQDRIATSTIINNIPKGKPIYWWNDRGLYWGEDNSRFITESDCQRHILTAYLSSDKNLTDHLDTNISLSLDNSCGNKLSVSNGNIVIGSGVSKVLVSAKGNYNTLANVSAIRYLKVKQNGTEIIVVRQTPVSGSSASQGVAFAITPRLINVQEGDVFGLSVQGYSGDTIRGSNVWTYMTIEVIE